MIELKEVGYAYPGLEHPAVAAASFSVRDGAACALLGPNGSGKSTLLRLVSGWLKPASGLLSTGPVGKAGIAYLSQIERISFSYSCLEYVLLGRAPHLARFALPGPADEQAGNEALDAVGMRSLAGRAVTSLSGGELQLVRLARCLAQKAAVLLLDEPTAMLDPAHALAVAEVLARQHAAGATILFSTHDLDLAAWLATDAILLKEGRVARSSCAAEALRPEELRSIYGIEFRRRLEALTPYPDSPTTISRLAVPGNRSSGTTSDTR